MGLELSSGKSDRDVAIWWYVFSIKYEEIAEEAVIIIVVVGDTSSWYSTEGYVLNAFFRHSPECEFSLPAGA